MKLHSIDETIIMEFNIILDSKTEKRGAKKVVTEICCN